MRSLIENCMKLGFGMMRLPKISQDGKEVIDVEQTKDMVDAFLAAGGKYIDTAFVYTGSEEATRKALVERHPRDSYYLATKLNAGSWAAKNEQEAKDQFRISLERTGAGYFDFYLLHALGKGNVEFYDKYGIWDYVKGLKEEGLIRHWGFSFHDSPEFLDKLLADKLITQAEYDALKAAIPERPEKPADGENGQTRQKGTKQKKSTTTSTTTGTT